MTADVTEQAPQLRAHFRQWLVKVEQPLSGWEQSLQADDVLVAEDRVPLQDRVLQIAGQIETALDLERVTPELRRELYKLVLQPDSPEALDETDDKIIDRLIGHAVRTRNLEDLISYTQAMAGGRHSAQDVRLKHMIEILQAIKDREEAEAAAPEA